MIGLIMDLFSINIKESEKSRAKKQAFALGERQDGNLLSSLVLVLLFHVSLQRLV